MVMSRYEFLAQAHAIVKPRVYLEVGVQFGGSLALAEAAELAIGIDPNPMVRGDLARPNQRVTAMTSDAYFAGSIVEPVIDFAFIDGSHLFEDALRDFLNVERHLSDSRSVVFFDDVLPYSPAIATREQPPGGDWTGDVWKIFYILQHWRAELDLYLIDVLPTGLLMALEGVPISPFQTSQRKTGNADLAAGYDGIVARRIHSNRGLTPHAILTREDVVSAEFALDILRERHTA